MKLVLAVAALMVALVSGGQAAAQAPHWCTIGDSITDHNSVRPNTPLGAYGGSAYSETIGWMPWFLGLSGSPQIWWDPTFDNFGVSGDQTGDVLTRMTPILSHGCTTATLLIGTNNITSQIATGTAPATVLANLKTDYLNILGQLQNANIRPIVFTLLPRGDASGATGPMRYTLLAFNSWLRLYAATHGIALFDAHQVIADPLSATGGEIAGTMMPDHTHPNAYGAYLLGTALAAQIGPVPQSYRYMLSPLDAYNAAYNPSGNLVGSAQFVTTTAMPAISGLTTSGVIPSGFTFTRAAGTGTAGTVTGSIVAAADGDGNWLQLDFGGLNGSAEIFQLFALIPSANLAAGDILDCWGQVQQLAGSSGGALNELSWAVADASAPPTLVYTGMAQGTSAGTLPTAAFTGTWALPAALMPTPTSGTFSVRMIGKVSIAPSTGYTGSIRFRLPTCRKRIAS